MPMSRRCFAASFGCISYSLSPCSRYPTRVPSTQSRPALTVSRWLMQRRNVDFPEPEGPTRQSTSPRSTSSEMDFSTWFEPYDFETRSAFTMGTAVDCSVMRFPPRVEIGVRGGVKSSRFGALRHRDEAGLNRLSHRVRSLTDTLREVTLEVVLAHHQNRGQQ